MADERKVGHWLRRRMGAPSNHFGSAMANTDGDNDYDTGDPQEDYYEKSRRQ